MPGHESCPKRMHHGPCGGVRADLSCEMAPVPCPFAADLHVRPWTGAPLPKPRLIPQLPPVGGTRPFVLADFTVRPFDPSSITAVAGALAGSCDGVLVGEHHNRPDFPPTLMGPWSGRPGALPGSP